MPDFVRKYSDQQRDAVASAVNDRGIRPMRRVVELAAAGELTDPAGLNVPPFTVNIDSVRSIASKARAASRGDHPGTIATLPHRDAVEGLRRRIIAATDHELRLVERLQRNARPGDTPAAAGRLDRLRQATRALREAAALPGPTDPRPVAPGERDDTGRKNGGTTRGGLAGALLADHRATATTAPDAPPTREEDEDQRTPRTLRIADANTDTPAQNPTDAGSVVRAFASRLGLADDDDSA